MTSGIFEVDTLPGLYLITPGFGVIPFASLDDLAACQKAFGIDPASTAKISKEMYDRFVAAVPVGSGHASGLHGEITLTPTP